MWNEVHRLCTHNILALHMRFVHSQKIAISVLLRGSAPILHNIHRAIVTWVGAEDYKLKLKMKKKSQVTRPLAAWGYISHYSYNTPESSMPGMPALTISPSLSPCPNNSHAKTVQQLGTKMNRRTYDEFLAFKKLSVSFGCFHGAAS